ncbi:FlgD immunoglobulin-like domain containing protein [Candidatus Latescibacterota bacterium]
MIYQISNAANAHGVVPLVAFKATNDSAAAVVIDSVKVTTTAAVVNGDRFQVTVYKDVDANGIINKGDTAISAATALPAAASTALWVPLTATQSLAATGSAGATVNFILGVTKLATAVGVGDLAEIILDDAAGALTFTSPLVKLKDTATATLDAGDLLNVPNLTAAAVVGTLTNAAHSGLAMAAGDFPNMKAGQIIHRWEAAADGANAHTLEVISLTTVLTGDGLDFNNVRVYIDVNSDGLVDAGDVELTLAATTVATGAGANNYTLTTPVFFDKAQVIKFVATVDGLGTASEGEAITFNLTAATSTMDGGVATAVNVASAIQTIDALVLATATTRDFIGHSYNSSRPNGYLDAVALTFEAGSPNAAVNINDATVSTASLTISDDASVAYSGLAFNATYQGDAVNDNMIYLSHTEKINVLNSSTKSASEIDYTAATKITSLDGDYALVPIVGGAVADGAGPAPISITTDDAGGAALLAADVRNGLVDRIYIQFSEALAGAGSGDDPGDVDIITVAKHTATNIAVDCLDDDAGWGVNTILAIDLDEITKVDGSEKPAVSFAGGANVLEDANGNDVAAWAAVHLNVTDGAQPTLVKVETQDSNTDGHLDALKLTFSENIALATGAIEADLLADFEFAGGFDANYSFTTGIVLSGKTLTIPVIPRAEYDSGVKPLIKLTKANVSATGILTVESLEDVTGAVVEDIAIILPVATVTTADEVVLKDSIRPVLTSATTLDTGTVNGYIDQYKLIFSEAMDPTVADYDNIKVGGTAVTAAGAVVVADTVWVKMTEGDDPDTGTMPEVTYTIGVAVGDTTITDANANILASVASGDVTEADGAAPLIVAAKTQDIGYGKWVSATVPKANNGQIDAMLVTFSEPLDTTKVMVEAGNALEDEFSFTATWTVSDTLPMFSADLTTMTLPITENTGTPDTDALPQLVYTAAGEQLEDEAGLDLPDMIGNNTLPAVTETDGAAPVASSAVTVDDNNDGFIDGFDITFTEAPVVGKDDTVKVMAGVTVESLSNDIDLTAAKVKVTGMVLSLDGTSSMGSEKWDTDKLPMIYIAAGNGIKDAAKNEVAATPDSVATADGAAPIIAKALGQKEDTSILITFSEPVSDELAGLLTKTDIEYINYADSTDMTAITAIAAGADAENWTATTDNTLTDDHVTMDKISVVAGKVQDLSAGTLAAYVDSVSITDPEVPLLTKAETMDINVDGYIDNIKLTFTEAIRDANLSGFVATEDSLIAIPTVGFAKKWDIAGYDVIGVNLTTSTKKATLATAKAGVDIYNVGDTHNDNVLYLSVATTGEKPDTGAKPKLSMTGDNSGGSGVSDYAPNYVVSITDFQVTDKAGIVIMDAEMTSTTVMEINLSESVNTKDDYPDGLVATAIFNWKVGNQKIENNMNVADVIATQPYGAFGKTHLILETLESQGLKPGQQSTIALIAGQLEDNSTSKSPGVLNAASADPVDVTPAVVEEPVAVEGLPDAFALSKNFPNPFNPTTTIEYAIPADGAGHVDMVIYNINGQKVRTLVNETQDAGYYNVVWDGRNDSGEMVSSGLYLYKIVSGSFNKIEKMTFMK